MSATDLWNNAIGREIAYEMKWRMGDDYALLDDESASEFASQKIWEKMQQGELITNPFTDKRKFENMELERLKESDKIFSDGEFKNFDEKTKAIKIRLCNCLWFSRKSRWQTVIDNEVKS